MTQNSPLGRGEKRNFPMTMCWCVGVLEGQAKALTGRRVVAPGGDVCVSLSHPLWQPLQLLHLVPAT